MKTRILGAAALGLLVAACGTDPQERVSGGAAAGAATGAGVGALGGPVGALAGAGIGAAAGAATGAATDPSDVNLGRPLWEDPDVRVPGTRAAQAGGGGRSAADPQTRQLQQALRDRGFDPGPIDGINGPRTREAIMDYQRANNMQATGRPSQQMMSSLGVAGGGSRGMAERDRAHMGGGMVGGQGNGATGAGGMPSGATGGGTERPNPPGAGGALANPPSNNPMNDPVGGSSQGNRPGFNQNR
jgi:hypothetical protein